MDDSSVSAFTDAERTLLDALCQRGVRFMIVGLSAAVLQGANTSTRDIDLWFADASDPRIAQAVRDAGGIWISGTFGIRPPQIGGDVLGDRLDVVTHMHGLGTFDDELANTRVVVVDGIELHVLHLRRILASKRATGRPRDVAAIPALEEALAALDEAESR
jgi:predicted nucleotidyltransferase